MDDPGLIPRFTPYAEVVAAAENRWRLAIPAGEAGSYRLAQLDDTRGRRRGQFLHQAPLELSLRARVSAADHPGTWGFGLWNDPFSAGLGLGGAGLRLPALPNAAWFFHASEPNWLSLRDDRPGRGMLAQTFRSPLIPGWLLALGAPFAGLLAIRPLARLLRRPATRVVLGDSVVLDLDVAEWHAYSQRIKNGQTQFFVDNELVFETGVSPRGRLGAVIWIDNQYAAWTPDGRVRSGTLANPPAWSEIWDLKLREWDADKH